MINHKHKAIMRTNLLNIEYRYKNSVDLSTTIFDLPSDLGLVQVKLRQLDYP